MFLSPLLSLFSLLSLLLFLLVSITDAQKIIGTYNRAEKTKTASELDGVAEFLGVRLAKSFANEACAGCTDENWVEASVVNVGNAQATRRIFSEIVNKQKKKLVIVSFGGSISTGVRQEQADGSKKSISYSLLVAKFLKKVLKRDLKVKVEVDYRNNAVAAVSSQYVFHCKSIQGDEDVVILEFAINDLGLGSTLYFEAIIRRLMALKQRPVIIMLGFPGSSRGKGNIFEREQGVIADKYGIMHVSLGEVWKLAEAEAGKGGPKSLMANNFFGEDGLHPTIQGHQMAAYFLLRVLAVHLSVDMNGAIDPLFVEPNHARLSHQTRNPSCQNDVPVYPLQAAGASNEFISPAQVVFTQNAVLQVSSGGDSGWLSVPHVAPKPKMGFKQVNTVWRTLTPNSVIHFVVDPLATAISLVVLRDVNAGSVCIQVNDEPAFIIDAKFTPWPWLMGAGVHHILEIFPLPPTQNFHNADGSPFPRTPSPTPCADPLVFAPRNDQNDGNGNKPPHVVTVKFLPDATGAKDSMFQVTTVLTH